MDGNIELQGNECLKEIIDYMRTVTLYLTQEMGLSY